MRYAPDQNSPMQQQQQGGGNNNRTVYPAFQPGQLGALASQLNAGFGGGVADWKANLRNTYNPTRVSPFHYGGGGGNHHGGGNNNGGDNNPSTGPNQPTDGGFDPASPRHRMAPPMAMNRAPMPMQIPQTGLLNAPVQQQQQGLLGSIPPEVLSFLANTARR